MYVCLLFCLMYIGVVGDEGYTETNFDYDENESKKVELSRVRRYDPHMTFDPENEEQVKEALNHIFSGRRLNLIQPQDFAKFLVPNNSYAFTKLNEALTLLRQLEATTGDGNTREPQYFFQDVVDNITGLIPMFTRNDGGYVEKIEGRTGFVEYVTPKKKYDWYRQHTSFKNIHIDKDVDTNVLGEPRYEKTNSLTEYTTDNARILYIDGINDDKDGDSGESVVESPLRQGPSVEESADVADAADEGVATETTAQTTDATDSETTMLSSSSAPPSTEKKTNATTQPTLPTCVMPTTTTTTTTTTTRTTMHFDIEKFLEIVANLTYDYYTNLTQHLNMTLRRMSAPTCSTPTPPTTEADYTAFNESLRAKCFVCGMEHPGVPYDANCADAFAGDFIPLVPQNPKSKGSIAAYRKYCLFKDINNYFINTSIPRMVFGRWTGGCVVRWTDVSGIYTQRMCRSKYKAAVGKNYASKRMAKLEMTLTHLDNGCIISPVATLLPLSRAISLYSRIHACVCTGNWCNMASRVLPTLGAAILSALTLTVTLKIVTS